jgi:hypothetical protein
LLKYYTINIFPVYSAVDFDNTIIRVRRLKMKFKKIPAGLVAVFALSAVLAMCGKDVKDIVGIKSGNGGNGGSTGASAVSWGVMKKGSVIVNGVTFDPAAAEIIHDDSPATEALLQDGMNVKLRGRLNPDGVTGAADKIRTDSEVRGTIVAKGVDSIALLDQQVFVDSRTVFANVASFQALTAGQWVEVHGMRDPQDRLLATRIEVLDPASGPPSDRLKGVASAPFTGGSPPALTFTLRGLTIVTTQGTLIQPAGASINPGDFVKVHGFLSSGTTFTAGRIDREDLEVAEFEPQESDEFKVEGFVSGFTALTSNFTVGQITTRLTGSTRFEDGVPADLVNNMRVEAEGRMAGGVLTADKIKFDDADRIVANADAAGSANVLGKIVVVTSRTELSSLVGGVAGIAQGQGLKVRGFSNPDGTITATQVDELSNPAADNKIIIQGVTEAFSATSHTITVLGIAVNAAGATEVGRDGQILSLDQLFAQLTVDRTIVKVTGSFSPGPPPLLTASEIDIE